MSAAHDKLVTMANQIATFWKSQKQGDPAESVASHIRRFWDPEMRRRLFEMAHGDAVPLDPVARAAALKLGEG